MLRYGCDGELSQPDSCADPGTEQRAEGSLSDRDNVQMQVVIVEMT